MLRWQCQVHCAVFRLVLGLVTAYELSCPDQSQRHFLQQNCTSSTPYYTCLFNVIDKRKESECVPRDYLVKKGLKKVRKPGITDANCTEGRYQPTTFYASQLSECLYLKSGCEEEGQVVVSNGTGSRDRSCRCDYRAGYTYVIPPRNQCACVPSEEDCSCRKMYCQQNEALSEDYKCEKIGGLFLTVCKSISTTTVPSGDKGIVLDQLNPLLLSNTPSNISGNHASVGVLLLLCVGIMVVALLLLRVCPEIQSYNVNFEKTYHVIQRDDVNHKYTVINGCDMELTLTYKSLLPIRQIMLRNVSSGELLEGKEVTGDSSGQMLEFKEATGDSSGRMMESQEVRDSTKDGYRLWGVKETSYNVSNLQTTSTGTYDTIIINMIGLPSSLMDWWNTCHERLENFIYNRSDEKTPTNRIDLVTVCLLEVYTPKNVTRGQTVTLELKKSEYSLMSWLRLGDNDQLSVVTNDRTQPGKGQKYTGGVSSNPSLSINQTCMGDGGRYCCFVVPTNGETISYGWKLRVIPQEHGYTEMVAHRSDTEYVRTSVVSKARDCLERNGVLVIKGREGTGKTKLAIELALIWEEKYLPVIVRSEDDVTEEFDESNILYIFDHSNSNEQYWIDKLEQCLLRKQPDFTCKAVFMIRNFMFRSLKELKIKEDVVVDLDSGLLEDDKQNILTLYMKKNNIATVGSKESNFSKKEIIEDHSLQVKLDQDSVAMIIKTEPILGFPLTAKEFCASRSHLQLGEKYFRNPPENVINEIKILETDAKNKSASLHEALLVVVLAYITLSNDQRLNINYINYKMFIQTHLFLIKDKGRLPIDLNADLKEVIQKAADSLVGDYLTCSDGVYEFIHPYYAKAVVLALPELAPLIVHCGKLELVLEYVRGDRGQKDNTVVRLAEIYYPDLCELLVKDFFQHSASSSDNKTAAAENIGHYIYNYWIKDRNVKFCSKLFSFLEKQLLGELEDKVLPLHVFSLLKYMTSTWNDPWIYSPEVIQDVLIIYGMLALYQVKSVKVSLNATSDQTHIDAKHDTVSFGKMKSKIDMLISKLKGRFEETKSSDEKGLFSWKLGTPLDQHGNTFFHYLVLLVDELACFIFNTCSKYVQKEWTAKNAKGMRPIDLAVAFGRPKLCKAFIDAYEFHYPRKINLVVIKEEWMQKKKERLKTILKAVQSGDPKPTDMSSSFKSKKDNKTKKEDIAINSNENFDPDIVRLILSGSKEDYKALSDILKKL